MGSIHEEEKKCQTSRDTLREKKSSFRDPFKDPHNFTHKYEKGSKTSFVFLVPNNI